ncbi:magnesium transporter NIPA-domain-containing protein [Chytriomyces cf. hyalinus JEL632]|nr:magnesium transporter NIPA-domain-containing protein [Chytriomyces cf. hyalinus JEL632]
MTSSANSSSATDPAHPPAAAWQSAVGISLALASNAFIGASVVFRKRGLVDLASSGHDIASGSNAYLRNVYWWLGMLLLAIGEVSNFGAYAFSPAILVTPLGTLSVVISAVLANYFLKERLTTLGKLGCALCILGVVMIVTHAPTAQTTATVPEFIYHAIQPAFIVYTVFIGAMLAVLIYYAEPRYARTNPFVYVAMSSCGGSYLVLSAQGVGSSIVTTVRDFPENNQFLQWPMYPLILFMVLTIVFQITYLNKAMAVYSTAIIYPIHYVCFTGVTIISTAFLFREFPVTSLDSGASIVEGFLVLVAGVMLLYMSNLEELNKIEAENIKIQAVDTEVTDLDTVLVDRENRESVRRSLSQSNDARSRSSFQQHRQRRRSSHLNEENGAFLVNRDAVWAEKEQLPQYQKS